MRADFRTCALLGKKAAPGQTSQPPKGGSVMQLETKDSYSMLTVTQSCFALAENPSLLCFASMEIVYRTEVGTKSPAPATGCLGMLGGCRTSGANLRRRSDLTMINSPGMGGRQIRKQGHMYSCIDIRQTVGMEMERVSHS